MSLPLIQAFEPLFFDYKYSKAASAYYIYLITQFPSSFESIYKEARSILKNNVTLNQLRKVRQFLLDDGLIAQVILTNDLGRGELFGREMYLPINPALVCQGKCFGDINISIEQTHNHVHISGRNASDIYIPDREAIEELMRIYNYRFKTYGIGTELGSVTVLSRSRWILNTVLNQPLKNATVNMMLSGLTSLSKPSTSVFYDKYLKGEAKLNILFDTKDENAIKRAIALKYAYHDSVELRQAPINHGTTRRIVLRNDRGGLAIDSRKLLSETAEKTFFEGTVYLQANYVDLIDEAFSEAWDCAKIINSIP